MKEMNEMKRTTATLSVAVLALAGCSSSHTDHHKPSPSSPTRSASSSASATQDTAPLGKKGAPRGGKVDTSHLNRQDSKAVAAAAVQGSNQVDTDLDNAPVDAQRRMSNLMTPQLAQVLAQPLNAQTEVGAGFPGWDQVKARHGWTTVSVKNIDDTGAGDSGNTSAHKVLVTVTGHDAHGWSQQVSSAPWIVQLSRVSKGAPWQVLAMEPMDAGGN